MKKLTVLLGIALLTLGCEPRPCYETFTYYVNGVPNTIDVEVDCRLIYN